MYFPAVVVVITRGQMAWVPVNETLDIYQRGGTARLTGQGVLIASGSRATIPGRLPVMIYLTMNPTVAGRVRRRCARSVVVGNYCRINEVGSGVIGRRMASSSICGVIAGRRVLSSQATPFDTIDLNENRFDSIRTGDSAGWTGRGPAWRCWTRREPPFCHSTWDTRSDTWSEWTCRKGGRPCVVSGNVRNAHDQRSALDPRVPRS